MRLLDAGAYGVICPMISSAEDAAALVAACRYPPAGRRSFGPSRGLLYGGADYFAHANKEILVLGMIETRQALDNLAAILATPGWMASISVRTTLPLSWARGLCANMTIQM